MMEKPVTVPHHRTRPNAGVQPPSEIAETPLWRIAARTVIHTSLWFMIPYLVAYYSVMGAWAGLRVLILLFAH